MTTISVAEGFRACQSFLGATLQEVVILSLMRELVQAYRCAGEELGEVCEPTPAKRTLAAVRRFGNSLKERCETFHLVDEPWAEV
jgi:hypothetical protein